MRLFISGQFLSTAPSSPSYGQGTSDRPAMNAKGLTPGPGMYPVPASIRSQAESKRSTQPAWSFGTSQRPSLEEGCVPPSPTSLAGACAHDCTHDKRPPP